MKKLIRYFLGTTLALTISACSEDFLEYIPEDQPTVSAWYNNEAEIRNPPHPYTDAYGGVLTTSSPGLPAT